MELQDYLRSAWRRLPLIAVVAAAVVVLGMLGEAPVERFRSESQVVFSFQAPATEVAAPVLDDQETSQLQTLVEVATSAEVLDPVIAELGLDESASGLASSITVRLVPGTFVIQVTAMADVAEDAENLSRAVSSSLVSAAPGLLSQVAVSGTALSTDSATSTAVVSSKVKDAVKFGVIGVVLGLGLSVIVDTFDPRIRNRRDLSRISSTLLVASVPDAEMTATLASRLAVGSPDPSARTVVVLPSRAGSAHQSVADELARGFAAMASPTVLLTSGGSRDGAGAIVVRDLDEALPSARPQDISSRLAALREEFSTVVVAASAVQTSQRTVLLTSLADVCLVVVEEGRVDRSRFSQTLEVLREIHPRTLAAALLPRGRRSR